MWFLCHGLTVELMGKIEEPFEMYFYGIIIEILINVH